MIPPQQMLETMNLQSANLYECMLCLRNTQLPKCKKIIVVLNQF